MKNQIKEIIWKFFDTDNVKFDFRNNIKLDESKKSPFFIDINGILTYPDTRRYITDNLFKIIENSGIVPDLLAGSDHSGIPFAALLSTKTDLPIVYIRNTFKKHGKQNKIEGKITGRKKAVIFTDYYSSLSKIDFAVKALEDENVNVKGILTVFNYTDDKKYKDIDILSLFDFSDFIEAASEKGYISSHRIEFLKKSKGWDGIASNTMPTAYNVEMEDNGAEILLDIKAVSLSVSQPYKYASGILSPIYCDNRLLISYPEKWKKIIDYMINIIESLIGIDNFDVIGGTSTAGIPHSSKIAE